MYGSDTGENLLYTYGNINANEGMTNDMQRFAESVRECYGDDITRLPRKEQDKIRFYRDVVMGLLNKRHDMKTRLEQDKEYYNGLKGAADTDEEWERADNERWRTGNRMWVIDNVFKTALNDIYSNMNNGTLPFDADYQKGSMSSIDGAIQKYYDNALATVGREGRRRREAIDIMNEAAGQDYLGRDLEMNPWPSGSQPDLKTNSRGWYNIKYDSGDDDSLNKIRLQKKREKELAESMYPETLAVPLAEFEGSDLGWGGSE